MLLPYPPDKAPDKYYCERCKPEDHRELLDAIARGEKPWEEVARQREAAAAEKATKKKKGGKRGRKGVSRPSEAVSEASPEVDTIQTPGKDAVNSSAGQKRKHEDPSNGTGTPQVRRSTTLGSSAGLTFFQDTKKQRQSSTHPTPASADVQNGARPTSQNRKSSVVQTPSRQSSRSEVFHGLGASSLDELPTQRKSVATSLVRLFSAEATVAQKQGKYSIPAGHTADGVGTELGLSVEHALYQILSHGTGDPNDAYKSQIRTILFNVKKNDALRDGLLNGSITGHSLAKMSPEEMASREQQLRDAKIKQEQEKQHVIVQEQGPRIRRTHKGEEYVDETQQIAAEPDSINVPVRRRESGVGQDVGDTKSPTAASPAGPRSPDGKPLSINTQARPRPSTEPERKSSQAFNIQDVWSSVQGSPDGDRPAFPQIPYQSGEQPEKPNQTEADPDIDALLKDEEVESPPYSPKSYDGDTTVVWRGSVNMSPVAHFQGSARKAAGADVENLGLTWQQLIPDVLTIEGRIDPARADGYLCGLRYSSTSDVIVVSLRASDTSSERHQFSVLFNYFKTRNRYGVGVNPSNPAIKDIYLIPLEAGSEKKPELLQLLDNDKIETPIQEDMLLVPIVIKTSELNANATPREHQPIAASPIAGVTPGASVPLPPTPTQTGYPTPTPPPGAAAAAAQHSQGQTQNQPQYQPQPANPPPQYGPQQQQEQQQQPTNQEPPPSNQPANPLPTGAAAPPPLTGQEAAHYILGPSTAQLHAVQQLLKQAPAAGIPEMNVVLDCLNENPAAGEDLAVLTGMLVARHQSGPTTGQ
jgi:Transcription factor S-II (TFIIS), central domain/SPOC domain